MSSQNWIRKRWQAFLQPAFRMEITLLLFGIILFQYFYFGRTGIFHKFFRGTELVKWLFYFYTPLVLIFAFKKVPDEFIRLGRIAAFSCTILGLISLEVAIFDSIHRIGLLDLCYHGLILFQIGFMLYHLLIGLKTKLDLHEKLNMDITPDWVSNVLILIWVFAGTILFSAVPEIKSYTVAQYTFLSGNVLLWILQWWRRRRKTKNSDLRMEKTHYNKSYR